MCVIARTMMTMAIPKNLKVKYTPQFKNTVISLALDTAVLTTTNSEVAIRGDFFHRDKLRIRRTR